jgi:hypothetical protein
MYGKDGSSTEGGTAAAAADDDMAFLVMAEGYRMTAGEKQERGPRIADQIVGVLAKGEIRRDDSMAAKALTRRNE